MAPSVPAIPAATPKVLATAPVLVERALAGVPPDDPRMELYSHGGYALFCAGAVWTALVLWFIVASGLGGALQRLAARASRSPIVQAAICAALLSLLSFAGSFPLALYGDFLRERAYGFAHQGIGGWLGDQAKALLVGTILPVVLVPILYAVLRRLGRNWWIAGSAVVVGFLIVVLAVAPVFIAPLFNTLEPLRDPSLRDSILSLARAQGIPAGAVYQVDASRQSGHTNAYVAGLLGTQRIVLYDTLLERLTPREIRFVMGHEMGHYVLAHVWKTVAFLGALVAPGLFAADRVARRIVRRRPAFGIRSVEEPASLPLMALLAYGLAVLALPAVNAFSRAQESAADRFGLEVTRDPEAAASSFVKFGRYDLGEYRVDPFIEALLYSHPSLEHRIRAAQAYARAHPETVRAAAVAGAARLAGEPVEQETSGEPERSVEPARSQWTAAGEGAAARR